MVHLLGFACIPRGVFLNHASVDETGLLGGFGDRLVASVVNAHTLCG